MNATLTRINEIVYLQNSLTLLFSLDSAYSSEFYFPMCRRTISYLIAIYLAVVARIIIFIHAVIFPP